MGMTIGEASLIVKQLFKFDYLAQISNGFEAQCWRAEKRMYLEKELQMGRKWLLADDCGSYTVWFMNGIVCKEWKSFRRGYDPFDRNTW